MNSNIIYRHPINDYNANVTPMNADWDQYKRYRIILLLCHSLEKCAKIEIGIENSIKTDRNDSFIIIIKWQRHVLIEIQY